MKSTIFYFFNDRFKEPLKSRPIFVCNKFNKLIEVEGQNLEQPLTMEELELAVSGCEGSKAPGPDGLNFNFIKKHWNTLRVDFFNAVNHFLETGVAIRLSYPLFLKKKWTPSN